MARKNKISVSNEPTNYRLSSNERRAARLAEIANKQGDLKREAAERRAKQAKAAAAQGDAPSSGAPKAPSPRRSYTR